MDQATIDAALEQANRLHFAGQPIREMTREELIVVAVWSMHECARHSACAKEYLDTFAAGPR